MLAIGTGMRRSQLPAVGGEPAREVTGTNLGLLRRGPHILTRKGLLNLHFFFR